MATYERSRANAAQTIRFQADDGRRLEGDVHEPPSDVKANVVIHGATAVPRRHYDAFARHLASHGYRVLVYDYRGVGGSADGHPRRDPATMTDWFRLDAPAAVRSLVAIDPRLPLLAVGHSFGGQVAAALEGVPTPRAIATAGAQRGYWAEFPWPARPRMWINWFVLLPALTSALGYLPGAAGLGVDMPSGIVREWASWCREPSYYLRDHPSLADRLAAYEGPLFASSVTDDEFAPLANVEWLLDRHARAAIDHLRFTPDDVGARSFGHFGFFRTAAASTVWPEIVGFFDEVLGRGRRPRALASRAPARVAPSAVSLDDDALLEDLAYGRA